MPESLRRRLGKRRFFMMKPSALIGMFLLVLCAPLAHADFVISYQLTGGAATQCADVSSASPDNDAICFGAALTNLGSNVFARALIGAGSQDPGLTEEISDSLRIDNEGSKSETLTLWLADQDFTSPTGSGIQYVSSLSITSFGGAGSVQLESCIDKSNGTAPPSGTFCSSPAATLTSALEKYNFPLKASNSDSEMSYISLTNTPYALSEKITLVLGAGSKVNLVTSQTLSVPEPASLILLGSTLLGASLMVRRRIWSKRA
jgi:hypothetical protein